MTVGATGWPLVTVTQIKQSLAGFQQRVPIKGGVAVPIRALR